jgi:hypothetical protein
MKFLTVTKSVRRRELSGGGNPAFRRYVALGPPVRSFALAKRLG